MTETLKFDFGDGRGPIDAYKHPNGGGIVEKSAHVRVSASASIAASAKIFGFEIDIEINATVGEGARVGEGATVGEGARDSLHLGAPNNWSLSAVWHNDKERKGIYVSAGCRYFALKEAVRYWARKPDRAEIHALITSGYIEKVAKLRGWKL